MQHAKANFPNARPTRTVELGVGSGSNGRDESGTKKVHFWVWVLNYKLASESKIAIQNLLDLIEEQTIGTNCDSQFLQSYLGLSVVVESSSPNGSSGTNPDGVYFGRITDAMSLPVGACTSFDEGECRGNWRFD